MKTSLSLNWAKNLPRRVQVDSAITIDLLADFYDRESKGTNTTTLDAAIDAFDWDDGDILNIIYALQDFYPEVFSGKTITAVNEIDGSDRQRILYQFLTYAYNLSTVVTEDKVLGIHFDGSDTPALAIILPDGDAAMPLLVLGEAYSDDSLSPINETYDIPRHSDTLKALDAMVKDKSLLTNCRLHYKTANSNKIWYDLDEEALLEITGASPNDTYFVSCSFTVEYFTAGIKYRVNAIYRHCSNNVDIPIDVTLTQKHHNFTTVVRVINNLK